MESIEAQNSLTDDAAVTTKPTVDAVATEAKPLPAIDSPIILSYEEYKDTNMNNSRSYDPDNEPMPANDRFHNLDHDEIRELLQSISGQVPEALPKRADGADELEHIAAHAKTICDVPYRSGKTIAFIGSMGSGKSTLINAILNKDEATQEMNAVTDYHTVAETKALIALHLERLQHYY
jgi:ABC-type glutathione transport system ATPase component